MRCVVALAVVVAARQAGACDAAEVAQLTMRAARYEARHEMGEAIRVRSSLWHCTASPSRRDNALTLAHDLAAVGEYETAASLIESAARWGEADASTVAAMEDAVAMRVARGDVAAAQRGVRWLWRRGRGAALAFDVGATAERVRAWSAARTWYAELDTHYARTHDRDRQAAARVGLGRSLEALGAKQASLVAFRRTLQLWQGAMPIRVPRAPPQPRRSSRDGFWGWPLGMASNGTNTEEPWATAQRDFYALVDGTAGRVGDVREAPYAEALLHVARDVSARCAGVLPPPAPKGNARAFWQWAQHELQPWLDYQWRCIDRTAEAALRIEVTHLPTWSFVGDALGAERSMALAEVIARLPPSPDELRVVRGEGSHWYRDTMGYDFHMHSIEWAH